MLLRLAVCALEHAAHGAADSQTTFPFLGPLPGAGGAPAADVVARLAGELEDLLLDTQLRADNGPLKSAVEDAVERRRRAEGREREREIANGGAYSGREANGAALFVGPQNAEWLRRLQRLGGGSGSGSGSGSGGRSGDASPVRMQRVVGYLRGRSRSLG